MNKGQLFFYAGLPQSIPESLTLQARYKQEGLVHASIRKKIEFLSCILEVPSNPGENPRQTLNRLEDLYLPNLVRGNTVLE